MPIDPNSHNIENVKTLLNDCYNHIDITAQENDINNLINDENINTVKGAIDHIAKIKKPWATGVSEEWMTKANKKYNLYEYKWSENDQSKIEPPKGYTTNVTDVDEDLALKKSYTTNKAEGDQMSVSEYSEMRGFEYEELPQVVKSTIQSDEYLDRTLKNYLDFSLKLTPPKKNNEYTFDTDLYEYEKSQPNLIWSFAKGFNEHVGQSLRTLHGAEKIIADPINRLFGYEDEDYNMFGTLADWYDKQFTEPVNVPDNIAASITRQMGGLAPMMMEMALMPTTKMKSLAKATGGAIQGFPKFMSYMGGREGLSEYERSEDWKNTSMATAKGLGDGAFYHFSTVLAFKGGSMFKNPFASYITGAGINSGAFMGHSAAQQYGETGEVDLKTLPEGGIMGAIFMLPQLKHTLGVYYSSTPRTLRRISKMKIDGEKFKDKYKKIDNEIKKERELAKKENREVNSERITELETSKKVLENIVSTKLITENIQKEPQKWRDLIKDDKTLSKEQRKFELDKIDMLEMEKITGGDPKIKELSDYMNKIERSIEYTNNRKDLSKEVKQNEIDLLQETHSKLKRQAEDRMIDVGKPVYRIGDESYALNDFKAKIDKLVKENSKEIPEINIHNNESLANWAVKKLKLREQAELTNVEARPAPRYYIGNRQYQNKFEFIEDVHGYKGEKGEKGETPPIKIYDDPGTKQKVTKVLKGTGMEIISRETPRAPKEKKPTTAKEKPGYWKEESFRTEKDKIGDVSLPEGVQAVMVKTPQGKELVQSFEFPKGKEQVFKEWFKENENKFEFFGDKEKVIEKSKVTEEIIVRERSPEKIKQDYSDRLDEVKPGENPNEIGKAIAKDYGENIPTELVSKLKKSQEAYKKQKQEIEKERERIVKEDKPISEDFGELSDFAMGAAKLGEVAQGKELIDSYKRQKEIKLEEATTKKEKNAINKQYNPAIKNLEKLYGSKSQQKEIAFDSRKAILKDYLQTQSNILKQYGKGRFVPTALKRLNNIKTTNQLMKFIDYVDNYIKNSEVRAKENKRLELIDNVVKLTSPDKEIKIESGITKTKSMAPSAIDMYNRKSRIKALREADPADYDAFVNSIVEAEAQLQLNNLKKAAEILRIDKEASYTDIEFEIRSRNQDLLFTDLENKPYEHIKDIEGIAKDINKQSKESTKKEIEQYKEQLEAETNYIIDRINPKEKPIATTEWEKSPEKKNLATAAHKVLKEISNHNFYSLLNLMDKKSLTPESSEFYMNYVEKGRTGEHNYKSTKMEMSEAFISAFDNAYGIKGDKQRKQTMAEISLGKKDNIEEAVKWKDKTTGEEGTLYLTRNQAMSLYGWLKDPTLQKTFYQPIDPKRQTGMGWNKGKQEALDNFLTKGDKAFVDNIMNDVLPSFHPRFSKTHKELNGTPLFFHEEYLPTPRIFDTFKGKDVTNEMLTGEYNTMLSTPNIKNRIPNTKSIQKVPFTDLIMTYADRMSYWHGYAPFLKEVNRSFRQDPRVRKTIEQSLTNGKKHLQLFDETITAISTNKFNELSLSATQSFKRMIMKGMLGAKVSQVPKQISSVFVGLDRLGGVEFMEALRDYADPTTRAINKELLKDNAIIQERKLSRGIDRDIMSKGGRELLKSKQFTVTDALMWFTKFGDAQPINVLYPKYLKHHYIDISKKPGESYAQAKRRLGTIDLIGEKNSELFARAKARANHDILRSQQSKESVDVSKWQRSRGLESLLMMYSTTPVSYHHKVMGALNAMPRALKAGDKKAILKNAKTFAIYHWLLPELYTWATNGFDFDKEDRGDYIRTLFTGNFEAATYLLGPLVGFAINKIQGLPFGFKASPAGQAPEDVFKGIEASQNIIDQLSELDGINNITMSDMDDMMNEMKDVGKIPRTVGFPEAIWNGSVSTYEYFRGHHQNWWETGRLLSGFSDHMVNPSKALSDKYTREAMNYHAADYTYNDYVSDLRKNRGTDYVENQGRYIKPFKIIDHFKDPETSEIPPDVKQLLVAKSNEDKIKFLLSELRPIWKSQSINQVRGEVIRRGYLGQNVRDIKTNEFKMKTQTLPSGEEIKVPVKGYGYNTVGKDGEPKTNYVGGLISEECLDLFIETIKEKKE